MTPTKITAATPPFEQPCQNPGCPNTIVDNSEETCNTCGHHVKDDTTQPPSSPGETGGEAKWLPMEDAPRDGSSIIGLYDDGAEARIMWSECPVCMLGTPNGTFPAGWATDGVETDRNLPMDAPKSWRPLIAPPKAPSQTPLTDKSRKIRRRATEDDEPIWWVPESLAKDLETALAAAKERGDSEERMRRTMETRHGEVLADCHSMRMLKDEVLKSWHDACADRDALAEKLRTLQQQVGEADKYSTDGVLHRMVAWFDYYFAKDGRTGPEPESHYAIYHDAKHILNSRRLARQPDQRQGEGRAAQ